MIEGLQQDFQKKFEEDQNKMKQTVKKIEVNQTQDELKNKKSFLEEQLKNKKNMIFVEGLIGNELALNAIANLNLIQFSEIIKNKIIR